MVGADSFGSGTAAEKENACRAGRGTIAGYTHFSVFYPHIRPFIDSTLPEITGGMLAPGQPAAFRLGPVDAPMLFSGDSSFQVEVPEGATRVTFTLESVDPDVNVDLYVRYGEDNGIRNGTVVSDYSSTGPTGNEQIVVTPQSDPPLRAGTYFVSLMLRTPGAVAEVTLKAEFDTPALAGGQIYYFPHLAVGASWQTTITYINYSAEEVTCRTEFLSDQGSPLLVSFPGLGTVVSRNDVLPPGGSVHEETDVGLSAPLAAGWARATCSGPVKSSLLFRQYDSAGAPVAEAGVNAAAVPATRFVTFAEQAAGQAGTGVAYANPSDTAALVTFTARDAAGRMLDSVDQTLMPGGHGAQNMAGLFGLPSFSGSLEITSREPIVTLSLNAEAAPVFSSLPPGELDPSAQGPTTYYFPHLAVGASWQTTITYINYSAEEVTCRTEFLSDQGSPLLVSFPGLGTVVSRNDVLPPGGSVHEETDVGLSAAPAFGWARATCSGPVKTSLLFRQYDSAGVPTGEAGVNAAAVPATRFVTFAEQAAGQAGTGVAYANPSDTAALVTFTARDAAGRTLDSVDQTLMPKGHGAQNMAGLFDLSSFTGSLEITSTEPIVTLSLNAEAAPVFSSLPPGELDAADIPGEMLAPADEAAFNDLIVGKRVRTDLPNYYIDFISPGRFKETEGAEVFSGSYTYRNTGPSTGTVTLNYDDGDRCTFLLTFTSASGGTATFSCNDGTSGSSGWRLAEIPPDDGDGDGDTNQVCATGRTIESGSECALQYPQGSPDAGVQFGRFAVGVQLGSEKGCLYIGAGFLSCSPGSISEKGTLTAPSGNRYPLDFAASKIEDSSSWRISKFSITLQE